MYPRTRTQKKRARGLLKDDQGFSSDDGPREIGIARRRRRSNAPGLRRIQLDDADNPFANPDVLGRILDYLPIKALFRVAFSSRSLLRSITYEQVVRSAMMAGGGSLSTMKQLAFLILGKEIYTPSIPRLLRLVVTGRGCEGCQRARLIRDGRFRDYGVAYCGACMLHARAHRQARSPKHRQPRSAAGRTEDAARPVAWSGRRNGEPHRTRDGEWAGPISRRRDAPADVRHPCKEHAPEILATFWAVIPRVRTRDRELEARRGAEARRREARKLARSDAHRRKQTRQVVQKFCDLIDDDKEWKGRATVHSYPGRREYDSTVKIPLVRFESTVVQGALKDLLVHLSRATPRALREAAQDVTRQLDELPRDGGLHGSEDGDDN